MKKSIAFCGLFVSLSLVFGCWTGPKTAVTPWALLKADEKVVYIEQSDRIPKDVLLAAIASQTNAPQVTVLSSFPYDQVAALLNTLLKEWPELAEKYGNERMNNALIGRRMLFRGYSETNLVEIEKIIKAAGGVFEYVTPQPGTRQP